MRVRARNCLALLLWLECSQLLGAADSVNAMLARSEARLGSRYTISRSLYSFTANPHTWRSHHDLNLSIKREAISLCLCVAGSLFIGS